MMFVAARNTAAAARDRCRSRRSASRRPAGPHDGALDRHTARGRDSRGGVERIFAPLALPTFCAAAERRKREASPAWRARDPRSPPSMRSRSSFANQDDRTPSRRVGASCRRAVASAPAVPGRTRRSRFIAPFRRGRRESTLAQRHRSIATCACRGRRRCPRIRRAQPATAAPSRRGIASSKSRERRRAFASVNCSARLPPASNSPAKSSVPRRTSRSRPVRNRDGVSHRSVVNAKRPRRGLRKDRPRSCRSNSAPSSASKLNATVPGAPVDAMRAALRPTFDTTAERPDSPSCRRHAASVADARVSDVEAPRPRGPAGDGTLRAGQPCELSVPSASRRRSPSGPSMANRSIEIERPSQSSFARPRRLPSRK